MGPSSAVLVGSLDAAGQHLFAVSFRETKCRSCGVMSILGVRTLGMGSEEPENGFDEAVVGGTVTAELPAPKMSQSSLRLVSLLWLLQYTMMPKRSLIEIRLR